MIEKVAAIKKKVCLLKWSFFMLTCQEDIESTSFRHKQQL